MGESSELARTWRPPSLAVYPGATTPDPGFTFALAWSTAIGAPIMWDGSKWVRVDAGARQQFRAYTECIGAVNSDGWAFVASGTGASLTAQAPGSNNAVGILRGNLGTTVAGVAGVTSNDVACVLLGKGPTYFGAKIRIPTLRTGSEDYQIRVGFFDSFTSAGVTDSLHFRYGSGGLDALSRTGGSGTTTATGITVAANTWYLLEIFLNAAGTSADFRVDGVTKATIAANIPTSAGNETGYGALAVKTVGTGSVNAIDIDFAEVRTDFSTVR